MGEASNAHNDDSLVTEIRFVVTGFGPFQSVTSNPTSILSAKLLDHLKAHRDPAVQSLASRTTTTVLQVSAHAVKEYLDRLSQTTANSATTTILLHMGVNYMGGAFQLEQCAYNDATFRIPDERGYRPTKECVVDGLEWNRTLTTRLDVPGLCRKLHCKYPGSDAWTGDEANGDPVEEAHPALKRSKLNPTSETTVLILPSTDPGRYVCNYTYCYSLDKFCSLSSDDCNTNTSAADKFFSLFLHVPPFEIIPEAEQIQFVVDLMQLIQEQVQNKRDGKNEVKNDGAHTVEV